MTIRPRLRKFVLTVHVVSSVGWLGAVGGSLALAVAGVTSPDAATVRGAYLTLDVTGGYVLVPLGLASLITGLVQAIGTKWGLFRHYWVIAKLIINVIAMLILLLYLENLRYLADLATQATDGDPGALRSASPVLHAGGAIVLLLIATTLSVFKPRGLTRRGWHRQREEQMRAAAGAPAS